MLDLHIPIPTGAKVTINIEVRTEQVPVPVSDAASHAILDKIRRRNTEGFYTLPLERYTMVSALITEAQKSSIRSFLE